MKLLALAALLPLCASAIGADTKSSREALNPHGRPDEKFINQERRYYVWFDSDGWHLRSTARNMRKFDGSVRVIGGSLRKVRPIGLSEKGNAADHWELNDERSELQFQMNTGQSFDGFDFDCDREATAVEFDLTVARKKEPEHIFVGRRSQHPKSTTFRFPADPDQAN